MFVKYLDNLVAVVQERSQANNMCVFMIVKGNIKLRMPV